MLRGYKQTNKLEGGRVGGRPLLNRLDGISWACNATSMDLKVAKVNVASSRDVNDCMSTQYEKRLSSDEKQRWSSFPAMESADTKSLGGAQPLNQWAKKSRSRDVFHQAPSHLFKVRCRISLVIYSKLKFSDKLPDSFSRTNVDAHVHNSS